MQNKRPIFLKPCPKCGESVYYIEYLRGSQFKEVFCKNCGFTGKKALTLRGAARKWNKVCKKVHNDD